EGLVRRSERSISARSGICIVIIYGDRGLEACSSLEGRMKEISRRTVLGTAATMFATPAVAEGCQVGPPQHHKGPLVFMDYDQLELDASYDQVYYEPLIRKVSDRL